MKILFIQAYSKLMKPVFPIGLARIAASVEGDHELRVFDPHLHVRYKDALKKEMISFRPDLTGISLRNIDSVDFIGRQYYYPEFREMLRLVHEFQPGTAVVVGGSGFSLFAKEIMQENQAIDVGVFLEGDDTFPELLANMGTPQKVNGLFYRQNGEVKFSGTRSFVDVKTMPIPAYNLFDLKRYLSRIIGIGIESKRGCGLKCSYCPYPFLNGGNLRMRSPQSVVDEMEYLLTHHNIRHFAMVDSVFNIPIEHSMEICRQLIDRNLNIEWSSWTNEKAFSEEYARLAVEAGCVAFPFSTDALNNESLKLLNKNYTSQDVHRVVEVARKIDDINVGFSFFLNPPGATNRSFWSIIRFYFKSRKKLGGKLKRVFMINRIRIEPHTKMHAIAVKEGVVGEETSLLEPVYYKNPNTRFLETAYNLYALLAGGALSAWRLIRRFF